jgi:hypothetical protein
VLAPRERSTQARSGQKREYLDWLEQKRSGTEWAPIPHHNADAAEAAVLLEVLPEADRLEAVTATG